MLLAIAGLAFTLVGFGITIRQLFKTRGAVEAANKATEEFKQKIASQNTAFRTVDAAAKLKAAQKEIRPGNWSAAIVELDELRQLLITIHRRPEHMKQELHDQLGPFLKSLADFSDHIEDKIVAGISDKKKREMMSKLRELSSIIGNLADDLSENLR